MAMHGGVAPDSRDEHDQASTGPRAAGAAETTATSATTATASATVTRAATGFTTEELEDAWRRALDDLEDARRQHARELRHEVETERHRICMAWLPVLDDLEVALDQAGGDRYPNVIFGMRAVRDQAVALLASLGFPRDDEAGVPFDPERHEVADVVDDPEAAPGIVVKVLRPGYGRPPGRRLRPAAVLVNRARS
jgi:molecular chaperone GrpE